MDPSGSKRLAGIPLHPVKRVKPVQESWTVKRKGEVGDMDGGIYDNKNNRNRFSCPGASGNQ